MKRLKLFILILHVAFIAHAQKQDYIWIFGDSTGLDFNTPVPTPLTGVNTYSIENSASISDSNGNLLFYCSASYGTDTTSLKNRLFQLMPNGNQMYGGASATQGSTIVPFPADTMKYYLFSFYPPVLGLGTHLYYSIIDISLDNGYGDVIQKNVLLNNAYYFTEKTQIVRHGNGRDWWLITHEGYSNNNKFIKYLITPSGISAPYYQNIGSILNGAGNIGQLKFSQSGNKLVLVAARGILNIFDFNRCTGVISNTIDLSYFVPSGTSAFYGGAFSSNEQILYVTNLDSLFQYDLTATNIAGSKQLLLVKSMNCSFGQLQLAPDDKIYLATMCGGSLPNNVFTNENMNLTVINDPDVYGPGCNLAPYSFSLGGRRSFLGLPNMQNYNLGRWAGSPCDTLTVGIYEIDNVYSGKMYPNPSTGVVNYEYRTEKNNTGTITINNVWGQELKRIPLTGGLNTLTIDCGNFADGIYLYDVLVNNVIVTKDKLIIIK
ncbi:MAG: T9SS type A sorting domain-containing protein [Arcticibacter sp.]